MSADTPVVVILPHRPYFGATLVLVPALLALKRRHPGRRIIGFANHAGGQGLVTWGLVDEIRRFDRAGGHAWSTVWESLALRTAEIVNFRPRSESTHLWCRAMPCHGLRRGFAHGLGRMLLHSERPWDVTQYKAFTYLGLVGEGWEPRAGDLLKDWSMVPAAMPQPEHLVIVPGGGVPDKKWPLEQHLAVARWWMRQRGGTVTMLAGPQEQDVHAFLGRDEVRHLGIRSVHGGFAAELATLRSATAVLGHDCGPNHIAQLMDRPRVVLFPAWGDPAEWLRPGPCARALVPSQAQPIASLTVEDVIAQVEAVAPRHLP